MRLRLRLPQRRVVWALVSSGVTVLLSTAIAAWSSAGIIANAIIILVVSLVGFHGAAWFSYERKLTWQALDYAL